MARSTTRWVLNCMAEKTESTYRGHRFGTSGNQHVKFHNAPTALNTWVCLFVEGTPFLVVFKGHQKDPHPPPVFGGVRFLQKGEPPACPRKVSSRAKRWASHILGTTALTRPKATDALVILPFFGLKVVEPQTYPLELQALGKLIFYRHIAHVTQKVEKLCF